jgi:hypothetical protein
MRSVSGSLVSHELLATMAAGGAGPLRTILQRARGVLGPASSCRLVFDVLLLPLLSATGANAGVVHADSTFVGATFGSGGRPPAGIASAGAWGSDLARLRDRTARLGLPGRWWIGANGPTLRIMDVSRAYTRRTLDFDLQRAEDEDQSLSALRALLICAGERMPALEDLISASASHRLNVGRSLQAGVDEALGHLVTGFERGRRRPSRDASFGDALTVVYRILFLLFAEARGLVPHWHPIYRDSYTIESLRPIAEAGGSPAGLWESLQAISRLAHRGCHAGTLKVVPFNGRLFAPAAAPLADSFRLDDRVAREVLLAVTTRPGRDRRERISYGDLGVEQLGAVYERVLDYTPGGALRKGSGTFYTPRAMTEFVVRRTLAPLVRDRTPEQILGLRIVDPALGSGAFLVAACRYLAGAYEDALIAEGGLTRQDVSIADRAAFRRVVAQRCLYGVDVNPTAVQLARLSLWLCTLAADKPLTFLDHHLRAGNSLVGASPADLARQAPGPGRGRQAALPLFESLRLADDLAATRNVRAGFGALPDDTVEAVRAKEHAMDDLAGPLGSLSRWRALADAWCAAWFWPAGIPAIDPRAWPALSTSLRGEDSGLPRELESAWRDTAASIAARERFFHWHLEFPEAFFDEMGAPLSRPGFDAVIGNPPWADAGIVARFTRESGCYHLQGRGHANLYQVFAERVLQICAPGGRIGMVMPSGFLADHGCADLRRRFLDRCSVDAVLGFDNRERLFPVHRSLRFSMMTATNAGTTSELQARFALHAAADLETVPDAGEIPGAVRVPVTLIRRFSGEGLAVPEIASVRDRSILARIVAIAPPLGSPDGWDARFGRELNATDDRQHFVSRGLPVLEGKHIDPFTARVADASQFIDRRTAERLLSGRARLDSPRLGYREVAAATNMRTLIAAVLPAGVVTTHTIFCLRRPADEPLQWFLCGIFNSFVANYLVRLRGGTHLPAAIIHQLPVPLLPRGSVDFQVIASLAGRASEDQIARAELQARCARAYEFDADDFAHVLRTFPLVPELERQAAFDAFAHLEDAI